MKLVDHIRCGLRTLRKTPGFAFTAMLTMALGIGATTAVFSVCDAMLWKPVPLPHLETLAAVLERNPEDPHDYSGVTSGDFADIAREAGSIASLAAWQDGPANIAGPGGEPGRVNQYLVSANFFDVIGVQPALGRGLTTALGLGVGRVAAALAILVPARRATQIDPMVALRYE